MIWLNRITPFRVATVLFVGYQLITFITEPSNFTSTGGSAWGGVAIVAALFWGVVLWLVDVLMRRSIHDERITWLIQSPLILAM
jgi:hypothetical protein